MRKVHFLTFSIIGIGMIYSLAYANPSCRSQVPDSEDADRCIKKVVNQDVAGLYNFALAKGHLADTGDIGTECEDLNMPGRRSYFSKDRKLFTTAIQSIAFIDCEQNYENLDFWACHGTIKGHACTRKPNADNFITTTTVFFSVSRQTGNILTFYPVPGRGY